MVTQPVVQYLPPAPAEPGSSFDSHQFANRHTRAVFAASRLSFSDIHTMHIYRRKYSRCTRWIPAFANNKEQVRAVIIQHVWQWLKQGQIKTVPHDMTLDELRRRCDARMAREATKVYGEPGSGQDMMHFRFVHCVQKAGGYLQYITAICYRSFSLGQSSVQIAEQMDMSPQQVRAQVNRLIHMAEKMGFETRPPHKSRGRKCSWPANGISGTVEPRKLKFRLEKWHFENRARHAEVVRAGIARKRAQPSPGKGTVSKKVLSGFDALKYLRRAQV